MIPTKPVNPPYLGSHEVARLASVSPSTVLAWIDSGALRAYRTPGGHRRVAARVLVDFLRRNGMPVPRELTAGVLLIDDDPAFLRATQRLLKRKMPWLAVETAEGPIDGLIKVGTVRPDAVVLDAYMPGMDGVEVCRRLHASPFTAHIKVVALTGRPSPDLEEAFRRAGAVGWLVKPLDVDELVQALGWSASPETP